MLRVCAWCHSILGKTQDNSPFVTHGICAECALREVAEGDPVALIDGATLLQLLTGRLARAMGQENGQERQVWLYLTERNIAALRKALDEAERCLRPTDAASPC